MSTRNWIAALSVAISIGVVSTNACAESFNRRGMLWTSAAPAGTYAPHPPIQATVEFFNNRGILWASAAPAGTDVVKPPVAAKSEGWIRR